MPYIIRQLACLYSTYNTILHLLLMSFFIHLSQIDSDDVITRDEQIYVLIGAHAKCERNIHAQMSLVKGLCAVFDHFIHQ